MSKGLNKVTLIGNLGGDPELRNTQSGTAVCNLRLATAERRKDGDNWKDYTEWHRIVLFGRLAEVARDYLKKGSQAYIEGSLRTTKYTAKDGVEKYSTEIVASELILLGKGERREPNGNTQGGGIDDESIPF